jgi:predicted transcriptional regulator
MSKTRGKRTATGRSGKTERTKSAAAAREPEVSHRWTFLTNHSHVLILLASNSDLVLREVAATVGITERAVQRIIQDLVAEGFIERERVGRKNRYRVLTDQPLRHPIEAHRKIGDLIDLISGD